MLSICITTIHCLFLSAASTNILFLQTLIFHPQTKVGAFQDTFSVSLTWIKFQVLLYIYVICNEHKMIRNIWIVLKTNKKLRKYLTVRTTELFNLFKQFQISDSFPSKFKLLYSEQWCHPCFNCLNSTEWSSSLFNQIWRISYDLRSPTDFFCSLFCLKPFSPSLSSFHVNIIKVTSVEKSLTWQELDNRG